MTDKSQRPSPIAPLGGVVVGIAVFLGVNITTGRAIIPSPGSVSSVSYGMSKVVYPATAAESAVGGAVGPYQTVCATCHQATGLGLPGAFPPLAGSEWLLGNPEVPVRIAIAGLSGPISVKGAQFNSAMPPPPGLTDEQIAEAVTFARANFGNKAPAVDAAFVKKVRDSLAGRTTPFTAAELTPLIAQGGEAAPAAGGAAGAAPTAGAPAAPGAAPAAPAPGAPTAGAGAAPGAAPAPAAPAPAAPAPAAPAPAPAPTPAPAPHP
jgi:hypothetical protein